MKEQKKSYENIVNELNLKTPNRIFVFSNSKMVEVGTHHELNQSHLIYSYLVNFQLQKIFELHDQCIMLLALLLNMNEKNYFSILKEPISDHEASCW
jgi:hypothetical protein